MRCSAVIGIIIGYGVVWGQTPPSLPEFEVADVQVTKPGAPERDSGFLPGGRLQVFGVSMQDLIALAWNVDGNRITGGPSWLDSDHFDIVAKAPHDATLATLRLMLQSLLMQRFGLVIHKEDKPTSVFALLVGKRGAKLKDSDGKVESSCRMQLIDGLRTMTCQNVTLAVFAERIRQSAAAYLDRPVIDMTGLTGAFDFKVAWTGRGKVMGTKAAPASGGDSGAPVGASEPSGGQTVFEAVDKQIGLRFEPQKLPLATIVIDHVNRKPAEQ